MSSHNFQRPRCSFQQRWLHLLIVFLFCSALPQQLIAQSDSGAPTPAPPDQAAAPAAAPTLAEIEEAQLEAQVDQVLQAMSPADKVGQLFITTFVGNDASAESDIAELIHTYRIGGVVLTPAYLNFSNAKGTDTVRQVATLTNQLQGLAYGVHLPAQQVFTAVSQTVTTTWPPANLTALTQTVPTSIHLPLFIAVEQTGDDLPLTALRNGFTPIPSQMALGATWNPELTRQVGEIVGNELYAVGVNLLLGPNVDVIDNPRNDLIGSLGLHSFGGDPYWVGKLAGHYITGVHQGGHGHVATIARHFPGQGDIDRLPTQDVATVQKSLEELRRISLVPFHQVTGGISLVLRNDGEPGVTDGLMTSHMRYSNLPGSAAPISVGPDLQTTLEQEGFRDWHVNGGLLMSNAIGVQAIRGYYQSTAQPFQHRQVALDFFTAGHDLIYLDKLIESQGESTPEARWPETKAAIIDIIKFFQERYTTNSDPGFAQNVDASVRRILRLKLRLYGTNNLPTPSLAASAVISPTQPATATLPLTTTFTLTMPVIPFTEVFTPEARQAALSPEALEAARITIGKVADSAVTVLKPNTQGTADVLPEAPRSGEKILIFSDSRLLFECKPDCTTETALGPEAIGKIILQLYGEQGSGKISPEQIKSRTLNELRDWLGPPENEVIATGVTTPTVPSPVTARPTLTATAVTLEGVDKAITPNPSTLTASTVLTQEISEASWVIFAMLDLTQEDTSVNVVKQLLRSKRSVQFEGKKVVILALSVPYFLDATELSRVTSYLGIYSKTSPFVESAVRALFRNYTPTGAPPVNVPGTEFANLADRLKPNPESTLELQVFLRNNSTPLVFDGQTQPQMQVGEGIRLEAGPLLDRNGRPVPDGTVINFSVAYEGETSVLNIEPGSTRDGFVSREVLLERPGVLKIFADADAIKSRELDLLVTDLTPPTPLAPAPTPTLPPQNGITPVTPTVPVGPENGADEGPRERIVDLVSFAVSLLTILITLSVLLIAQVQILPRHTLVHNMLWATIFGLAAYIIYGLGLLPGSDMLRDRLETFGPALVVFIAMLLPLLWLQLRTEQNQ